METVAVECPFDVLRRAEMPLDGSDQARDLPHPPIVEYRLPDERVRHVVGVIPATTVERHSMCHALQRDFALDDVAVSRDAECIRVALARDQRTAQAVNGADHRHILAFRQWIRAEGDAGSVGVDHALNQNGRDAARRRQPTGATIRDVPVREPGPPHQCQPFENFVSRDGQEAVELSGSRMTGAVLVIS
jgi:hypothetical protein